MSLIRSIGKGIGTVGGGVIGGSVKVVGKAVGNKWGGTGEWIEEIGEGIQSASKVALENAGQFLDGAVQGTYGALKNDEYHKKQGLKEIKDSAGKTVKGVGSTLKYSVQNVSSTYEGYKKGNKDQAIKGLKNLGKVVAVSGLAIGVVDLVDGADTIEAEEIDTRNGHLSGYEHPDTGVLFIEKTVDLPNGQVVEGTFPDFDEAFNVIIAEDLYYESDDLHFKVANDTLYQSIIENPNIANELGLSQSDLQSLEKGQTPEGYTWHHNEEPGLLQLVDEEAHAQTAHTGGRSIWGGGTDNR